MKLLKFLNSRLTLLSYIRTVKNYSLLLRITWQQPLHDRMRNNPELVRVLLEVSQCAGLAPSRMTRENPRTEGVVTPR